MWLHPTCRQAAGEYWRGSKGDDVVKTGTAGHSWIALPAGSETRLVPGAFFITKAETKLGNCNNEMNFANFTNWVEKLPIEMSNSITQSCISFRLN
jgi:hypothetical protein